MSALLCLPACLCVSAAASWGQAPHRNVSVPSGAVAQTEHQPTSRQAPSHVTTGHIDQNAVATLGVPLGNTLDAVFHVLIWRTVGVRLSFSIGESSGNQLKMTLAQCRFCDDMRQL